MNSQMMPVHESFAGRPAWLFIVVVVGVALAVLFGSASRRARRGLLIALLIAIPLLFMFGYATVRQDVVQHAQQSAQRQAEIERSRAEAERNKSKKSKSKSNSPKNNSSKTKPTATKNREAEVDGTIPVDASPAAAGPGAAQPASATGEAKAQPATRTPSPPEPGEKLPAEATAPPSAAPPSTVPPSVAAPMTKAPAAKTAEVAKPTPAPAPEKLPAAAQGRPAEADEHATDEHTTDERPAWVDAGNRVDADGTTTIVIQLPPRQSVREAQDMYAFMGPDQAFQKFIEQQMPRLQPRVRYLVDTYSLARQAKQDEYHEWKASTFAGANMVVVYQRYVFSPQLAHQVAAIARDSTLSMRAGVIVLVGICVLLAVGIVYAYLRIDTVTKGFYTWRLRILGGAALIGVCALFMFVMEEGRFYYAFHPLPDPTMMTMR